MTLLHATWRRRVSLLASGALDAAERAATLAHLEACASCRTQRQGLEDVVALLGADPLRAAEPPIPLGALVARVDARLKERERVRAQPAPWLGLRWLAAAAALVVAVAALLRGPSPPAPPPAPTAAAPDVSDVILRRMESSVVREQAARYLNDAQDVLVTVAAQARDCEKGPGRVDVGDEARKSRELLARRALLVEMDRSEVAGARPVLEDVERMLRAVASLESCARARDLDVIHREMEERRLLMKIDLMTRELLG